MALVAVFLAACTTEALLLVVPALIVAEIAIPDETLRLLAFGLIWSAATSIAALQRRSETGTVCIVISTLLLLRWIPLENTLIARELLLLVLAIAITLVLGRTPFAAAVAIVTALLTPAVPLRTFALPLAVLFVATLARLFGMPRLRLAWPSAIVIAFPLVFFAWSGIVARAFPYFLRAPLPRTDRYTLNYAMPPSQTLTIGVPADARAVIVSGANVARFRRGALLGRIEPGGIDVRIGDAADWGYLRRDHFYGSRNPLPRESAGKIRDYGYHAWVDGAGRVPLPAGTKTIRVTAAPALPADARLQVEAFEIATR